MPSLVDHVIDDRERDDITADLRLATTLLRDWAVQHAKMQGFPVAYEPYIAMKSATNAFLETQHKKLVP